MKECLETKEKTCMFYTSDYHFELISLPYIHKKLQEKRNITILTEQDLEKTIKELLNKINIKEIDKEKIFNINWKNDIQNKIKNIKSQEIIFIKGNKNYIQNINNELKENNQNYKSIKIIDCYNIDEIGEEAKEIIKNYRKTLKTTGEYEVKEN